MLQVWPFFSSLSLIFFQFDIFASTVSPPQPAMYEAATMAVRYFCLRLIVAAGSETDTDYHHGSAMADIQ